MPKKSNLVQKTIASVRSAGAEYVNLRFVDLLGRARQVTLPISNFGERVFDVGVAFDGSSVAGFTTLESGDLRLVPDPNSFFFETIDGRHCATFMSNCVEADAGKRFSKDPRFVVEKAEAFLRKTGIADEAYFMPELEFNLFDRVEVFGLPSVTGYSIESKEAGVGFDKNRKFYPWVTEKCGYHAVPPNDSFWGLRAEIVRGMELAGIAVKYCHHEGGTGGQCEIEIRPNTPLKISDSVVIGKYLVKSIASSHGVVATFLPKPLFGQPGNGMHFHQYLSKRGRNIFYRSGGYGNLSEEALAYIGGLLKHGRALVALTCASTNSYRRLVPGFEAPTCLVYAVGNRSAAVRIPKSIDRSKETRIEFRPSDATGNPYLSIAAMLMAGIDGIRKGIDPQREGFGPFDQDVYSIKDLEKHGISPLAETLEEALEALALDHEFLLEGDVFTRDLIEAWISLKGEEARRIRSHPHPYEIDLYLDC
ncbi:MAG: type I glutamate--ammonia ligase [bacterium]